MQITIELIIKIVLAIIFGLAVLAKLSGKTTDVFKKSGYGIDFMYSIAFAEALLAFALFTPYDLWAAIGLMAIMVGAIVTLAKQRVSADKYMMALLSVILLAVVVLFNTVGI